MHTGQTQDITPADLPEVITRYLDAHRARDTATALATFRSGAEVTDDGSTHRGAQAIETWLNHAAGEYTYTIEPTGARKADEERYVVTQHLEGDFPGGVVDLFYRFTLGGGLIENLVIEP
ncbi:nuclear transport factor 2 family protein [Streptomyces sp. NPDC088747]|uniref:nuclear transport factor 2 family protein n=1 Tax=Streptomyces sp. NPDC088747 TaxID=3365886 RepID=UPI00382683A3